MPEVYCIKCEKKTVLFCNATFTLGIGGYLCLDCLIEEIADRFGVKIY